jgi:hypothetical protein
MINNSLDGTPRKQQVASSKAADPGRTPARRAAPRGDGVWLTADHDLEG